MCINYAYRVALLFSGVQQSEKKEEEKIQELCNTYLGGLITVATVYTLYMFIPSSFGEGESDKWKMIASKVLHQIKKNTCEINYWVIESIICDQISHALILAAGTYNSPDMDDPSDLCCGQYRLLRNYVQSKHD